jgi:hypothetical protein
MLAILIALSLYAVALVPLIAWAGSARAKGVFAVAYGATILSIGLFQTGIFQRGTLTSVAGVTPAIALSSDSRCQQVLKLVEQAGLSIDVSDPAHIVIRGKAWDQAPQAVRDVVTACAERLSASGSKLTSQPSAKR